MVENENKKLLKEYIRKTLLKEYSEILLREYGDAYGDLDFVSKGDIAKIFIQPLTDFSSTIKAVMGKISAKANSAINVIIKGLPTLVVPGLTYNYSKIYEKEKERINAIKNKYKEVFDRTEVALQGDAQGLAFMLNPVNFLGAKLAQSSPAIAIEALEILTGGAAEDAFKDVKSVLRTRKIEKGYGDKAFGAYKKKEQPAYKENKEKRNNILSEQESFTSSLQRKFYQLLNNQQVVAALKKSPIINDMQRSALQAVQNSAKEIMQQVEILLNIDNLEELQNALHKKLNLNTIEQLGPEEGQTAEAIIIQQIKNTIIKTYSELSQKHLEDFEAQGIPEDSPLVQVYTSLVAALQSKVQK